MYANNSSAILPRNLYSAQQVKQGELICAEQMGVSMYQLMEKAGHAVFDVFLAHFSKVSQIAVVAGRGNNGGDAYVFARLALQSNYNVRIYSLSPDRALTGDAEIARQALLNQGGMIQDLTQAEFTAAELIIDGLLGTGFQGEVKADAKTTISKMNDADAPVIAIDLPSGLYADTGVAAETCVKANYTVTFVAPKVGLFIADGPDHTGHLVFAGLGIDELFDKQFEPIAQIYGRHSEAVIKRRKRNTNKGKNGHVICLGGNVGMPGAIFLAGKAALRAGVGKVSVICHPQNVNTVNVLCPELMVWGYDGKNDNNNLIKKISAADVILIGPGLGMDAWAQDLLTQALCCKTKPLILDADGLNLMAQNNKNTTDFINYTASTILTPHPLEAARLLNKQVSDINHQRINSGIELAKQFGSNIVLKGNSSLVINKNNVSVNLSGNSGMASAGMGDLLAGIIAAFLANKENLQINLNERVKLAVYLHGLAGDFAAKNGEIGIIATDIIEQLPIAIKRCST